MAKADFYSNRDSASWLKLCADLYTEESTPVPGGTGLPRTAAREVARPRTVGAAPSDRRLPMEELFRIGPDGLEDLSDATLESRVDQLRANLAHGFITRAEAEAREVLSQAAPLEAV